MKKRIRFLCIIVGIVLFLLLLAGLIYARMFGTQYPDAVAEAVGVYME